MSRVADRLAVSLLNCVTLLLGISCSFPMPILLAGGVGESRSDCSTQRQHQAFAKRSGANRHARGVGCMPAFEHQPKMPAHFFLANDFANSSLDRTESYISRRISRL